MQVLHVGEHLCVAVAAYILGTKKRKVKKELLHTPLLEITILFFGWLTGLLAIFRTCQCT